MGTNGITPCWSPCWDWQPFVSQFTYSNACVKQFQTFYLLIVHSHKHLHEIVMRMLWCMFFFSLHKSQSVTIKNNGANFHSHPLMLNTSAGWIWSRESQREIQESKAQFDKDVIAIKSDLEARYKETLTERRRAVATLELQLEKERQRVSGYKQAIASQSQHLMEERKKLQKVKNLSYPFGFKQNSAAMFYLLTMSYLNVSHLQGA